MVIHGQYGLLEILKTVEQCSLCKYNTKTEIPKCTFIGCNIHIFIYNMLFYCE